MNTIGSGGGGGLQQVIAMRQQILERSDALKTLRTNEGEGVAGAPKADGATSFVDTLKDAVGQVNAAQSRSGDMQTAYERGEVTDIAQVMLARQEAGVAFEATLQVRNKLLAAYQDIMKMGA